MLDTTATAQQKPCMLPVQVNQQTLATPTKFQGVGVHSGRVVQVVLKPAGVDTGIIFKRTDVESNIADDRNSTIVCRPNAVSDTRLCTKISNEDGVSVATIEHLMAGLSVMGIDNVVIEMDGEEMPIMDGSAEPFVFLIECAGLQNQGVPRRAIRIKREISVRGENGELVKLSPTNTLHLSVFASIDFDNPAVGCQDIYTHVTRDAFVQDFARARTFGFMADIEKLRAMGLARGGSTENAIIIGGDGVVNKSGLRYEDEFVRHKALDAVGDLYVAGAPILGHYHGERLGHAMNNKLLRALFADETAYEWVDMDSQLAQSQSMLKVTA